MPWITLSGCPGAHRFVHCSVVTLNDLKLKESHELSLESKPGSDTVLGCHVKFPSACRKSKLGNNLVLTWIADFTLLRINAAGTESPVYVLPVMGVWLYCCYHSKNPCLWKVQFAWRFPESEGKSGSQVEPVLTNDRKQNLMIYQTFLCQTVFGF